MRWFKPKTIPGWVFTVLATFWAFMENWHTSEFVFKKLRPGKEMPTLTAIISHPWVPIVLMIIGLTWIWWTTRISPNVKRARLLIQELYNQLDSIRNNDRLNWHNISYKRTELNEWKVIAKRLIFRLFAQQELDNFLEKINYIESRNEYCNADIGGIQAFLNEQDLYSVYLKGLLDSLEKHPELFQSINPAISSKLQT